MPPQHTPPEPAARQVRLHLLRHPKDSGKWPAPPAPLCPDCRFTIHSVKGGAFPADVAGKDSAIITGSPASVHYLDRWRPRLLALNREAVDKGAPLFGACFGHQAIALALGGEVGFSPGGWVLDVTETQLTDPVPLRDGPAPPCGSMQPMSNRSRASPRGA